MTDTSEIRRHPNGSIDTRHYMQIGRRCRSEALYDGGRAIANIYAIVGRAVQRSCSRPIVQYLSHISRLDNTSRNARTNSNAA
jgi:hypothetical protein